MIKTKDNTIEDSLNTARERAKTNNASAFVSITEPIDKVNPVHFFQAGKWLDKSRIFWSVPDRSLYYVGIGEAVSYQESINAYQKLKHHWKQLIEQAMIFNDDSAITVGPKMFGGFPFDTNEQTSDLWKQFNGSEFRVPTYLLTIENGEAFLTINLFISAQSDVREIAQKLQRDRELLLSPVSMQKRTNSVLLSHEVDPEAWKELVAQTRTAIEDGYAEKIVIARELQIEFETSVELGYVLNHLLEVQNNSYVFLWEKNGTSFIGATPERLVWVKNQQLLSACLAGTAPRGRTTEEDRKIGEELLYDDKNREEHQYVVDMIKGALNGLADDVEIPQTPVLYPLKNLQHLYTPVEAMLRETITILDVAEKLHPTPALCGQPTERAMSFIRENELLERGWYGAPIGWFDHHFNGEFAVAIRSGLVKDNKASLFAGCGVVRGSDPEVEYEETKIKFQPMLHALGGSK
ncbi:menaquinone-specific isochorismate synthase [Gracilibacillus halotolerans]|uniref:Isochorismate synthase MenF n=1 Tax=Gracilibacillus halotolerans TaxID=74386 RepID=A0A841RBH2_9BACI|nr:isochorismate synthase [Gracilibacillus halotolerans]MBB6511240.1 menaquinone-specific isochorismate synthase [Gracilibacillus halotolerans]